MKTLTKKEMEDMRAGGAVFFKKPGTKKKPESVVTAPIPLDDKAAEVIKAASAAIDAADRQLRSDTALADRITEAISANKRGPVSYRCIVHRGKDKLLSKIDIIPLENKR